MNYESLTLSELERITYMCPDDSAARDMYMQRCTEMVDTARLDVYNAGFATAEVAEIAQELDDELTELYHDGYGVIRDETLSRELRLIRLSLLRLFR